MGLLRGVARTAVIAGTATAVSNRVSRRQYGRWSQQAEEEQPQEAPAADDPQSRLAALQQLGELKAQGVLSEAEFEQEKARILGS
ncbi:hypothetical protein BJ973_002229 [Actinoplanes tereljensis]|uniref:SHOCT domain-containing protein n=1 Tax=Paractinoplanes tereljensis TaxID=571912 RepID=A0A919NQB3_9ACTN|nr:SHOCT domain-containing protein [Actinoplanes tereljensis]GIF21902.1 hypothetical protein Ate02nite_46320 [Actinoplanes tereljensis]